MGRSKLWGSMVGLPAGYSYAYYHEIFTCGGYSQIERMRSEGGNGGRECLVLDEEECPLPFSEDTFDLVMSSLR